MMQYLKLVMCTRLCVCALHNKLDVGCKETHEHITFRDQK